LERYGFSTVRGGELKHWLTGLAVVGAKHSWQQSIFEQMGADADLPEYVRLADGDVGDFIGTLNEWFRNPNRKDMSGAGN
jgi:hypothetical protein